MSMNLIVCVASFSAIAVVAALYFWRGIVVPQWRTIVPGLVVMGGLPFLTILDGPTSGRIDSPITLSAPQPKAEDDKKSSPNAPSISERPVVPPPASVELQTFSLRDCVELKEDVTILVLEANQKRGFLIPDGHLVWVKHVSGTGRGKLDIRDAISKETTSRGEMEKDVVRRGPHVSPAFELVSHDEPVVISIYLKKK